MDFYFIFYQELQELKIWRLDHKFSDFEQKIIDIVIDLVKNVKDLLCSELLEWEFGQKKCQQTGWVED